MGSSFSQVLIAILKGFFLFTAVGLLLAHLIILNHGEIHAHSMIELLYIWLSIAGIIVGCFLGMISVLLKRNVNKTLLLGSLFFTVAIILWWTNPLNISY